MIRRRSSSDSTNGFYSRRIRVFRWHIGIERRKSRTARQRRTEHLLIRHSFQSFFPQDDLCHHGTDDAPMTPQAPLSNRIVPFLIEDEDRSLRSLRTRTIGLLRHLLSSRRTSVLQTSMSEVTRPTTDKQLPAMVGMANGCCQSHVSHNRTWPFNLRTLRTGLRRLGPDFLDFQPPF